MGVLLFLVGFFILIFFFTVNESIKKEREKEIRNLELEYQKKEAELKLEYSKKYLDTYNLLKRYYESKSILLEIKYNKFYQKENELKLKYNKKEIKNNITDVEEVEKDILVKNKKIKEIEVEIQKLILEKKMELEKDVIKISLKNEIIGIEYYENKFNFSNSVFYKNKLKEIQKEIKSSIDDETFIQIYNYEYTYNKIFKSFLKLMFKVFNLESNYYISNVNFSNINQAENKIKKVFKEINKIGDVIYVNLSVKVLNLKLEELFLTYEMTRKEEEEKEEQRLIKERMREEQKAQAEFEKAIILAEKEEQKLLKALEIANNKIITSQGEELIKLNKTIEILKEKLEEALKNKDRAISMAQQTKSGYVYVISNIGSFGENIYKIGMTRRLEPMDRVKELSDASVPFSFDVHAMIFSENAPYLENVLHKEFYNKRVNKVNNRKEFFKVNLELIEKVVKEYDENIIFTKTAIAKQYRETLAIENRKIYES